MTDPKDSDDLQTPRARRESSLFGSLRGIAKGVWDEDGGGENWLRRERENFYGVKGEPDFSRIDLR